MEETGSDFTNTFLTLTNSVNDLIEKNDSVDIITKKMINISSNISFMLKKFHPRATLQQIQFLQNQ